MYNHYNILHYDLRIVNYLVVMRYAVFLVSEVYLQFQLSNYVKNSLLTIHNVSHPEL